MSDTLTRTVAGTTVPAAGTYAIDPSHSNVGFSVRHLGLSKVRGRFTSFSGTIEIADEPTASSVAVEIESGSIDTRDAKRDEHLRSADFFDAEQYPNLTYRSTSVTQQGNEWVVQGELTINAVTRQVPLHVAFDGSGADPWGGQRIAFTATTEIDREAFGLTWNQTLETGGLLVGKKIAVEIEVQAVKA